MPTNKLAVLREPVPVGELSTFMYWPFDFVYAVECENVSRRGTKCQIEDGIVTIPRLDHSSGETRYELRSNIKWVPMKGRSTVGAPITVKIHTPDKESPFYMFRTHDWHWQLNWMMSDGDNQTFRPVPNIKPCWAVDFIINANRMGIFWKHPKQTRDIPITWMLKDVPDDPYERPWLGGMDARWYVGEREHGLLGWQRLRKDDWVPRK